MRDSVAALYSSRAISPCTCRKTASQSPLVADEDANNDKAGSAKSRTKHLPYLLDRANQTTGTTASCPE